jgi:hypothetical protein
LHPVVRVLGRRSQQFLGLLFGVPHLSDFAHPGLTAEPCCEGFRHIECLRARQRRCDPI